MRNGKSRRKHKEKLSKKEVLELIIQAVIGIASLITAVATLLKS